MSHNVQLCNPGGRGAIVTIINYTQGGEPVTAQDVAQATIQGVVMGLVPPNANSLGVPLLPILVGSSIKLFQFSGGNFVEIPTTSALNAAIPVMVLITA